MAVMFCDTDCELWYTTVKDLKLGVIQMPYTIDGKEYLYDFGETYDFKAFFTRMREGATPITSAQNEAYYLKIFEPYFEKGEDILYVAFSEKMSSTFKNLDSALEKLTAKYPKVRFERFDTKNICLGAGIIVEMGARFFNKNGGDIDATLKYLENVREHTSIYFAVDNLKYLARGGRLSKSAATFGNLMQVKPVLSVRDGELYVDSKQNGSKKAQSYLVSKFESEYKDLDDAPVYILGGDCDDIVASIAERVKAIAPKANIVNLPIGPVIGCHCGPGTFGLIYTKK